MNDLNTQRIREIYLELPGEYMVIWEDPQSGFRAIPKDKDNSENRLKLISGEDSVGGRLLLGSHPDVIVHEGNVQLGWFSTPDRAGGFVAVVTTAGVIDSEYKCCFLERDGEEWKEISAQVFPQPDLPALREAFSALPKENLMFEGFSLGQLEYEILPDSLQINARLQSQFYEGDEAPVLRTFRWKDGKFVAI